MIAKRAPSAPPIDLVLSILYVAPYRLPGDDVSGSSVSRPSKPGQVGHVFILQPSRSSCALIATLSIPRTRTKIDRSVGSGGSWKFALTNIVPTAIQSCLPPDTSLVDALESKTAGGRLQRDSHADHNCVGLGIIRGHNCRPCRLACEQSKHSQRSLA